MAKLHPQLLTRLAQNDAFDKLKVKAKSEDRENMLRVLISASPKDLFVLRRSSFTNIGALKGTTADILSVGRKLVHVMRSAVGNNAQGISAVQLGILAPIFCVRRYDTESSNPRTLLDIWCVAEDGVEGFGPDVGQIEGCLSVFIPYEETTAHRIETDPQFASAITIWRPQYARVRGYRLIVDLDRPGDDDTAIHAAKIEDFSSNAGVTYQGIEARCVLHEFDHLHGKLHPDKLPRHYRERMITSGKY